MNNITRLNALHAATEPGDNWRLSGEYDWERAIVAAWPAIAAELTMLREFAQRVRVSCRFRDDIRVAGSVIDDIDWLDEIKKAGEP